jgi:serine/threonine-protein kinase
VDLPADLEAVISRCLERLPDNRYANAGELLVDLAGMTPNAY